MKLKEYMESHAGKYTLAESTRVITAKDLDPALRDLEIEPYVVGEEAPGERKIHLYGVEPRVHLVTHIEEVKP